MVINVRFSYSVCGSMDVDIDENDLDNIDDSIKSFINSKISFDNEFIDEADLDYIEYDEDELATEEEDDDEDEIGEEND